MTPTFVLCHLHHVSGTIWVTIVTSCLPLVTAKFAQLDIGGKLPRFTSLLFLVTVNFLRAPPRPAPPHHLLPFRLSPPSPPPASHPASMASAKHAEAVKLAVSLSNRRGEA